MVNKKCLSCQCKIGGADGKTDGGRGICTTCHSHHTHRGTLDQFPRKMWKSEELITEVDRLQSYGMRREDIAERLGITWDGIASARKRLRIRAEREANFMEYTEHDKLAKIAPLSQSIGEFVEWLGGESVRLMHWTETIDTKPCDGTFISDCRGEVCETCGGAKMVEVKRESWTPYGVSTTNMLASFFDIDQTKLEQEKRHMLEGLRKRNGENK